ncbi:hypothetical protein RUM43_007532 [Polyplax serrata]|uniref:Venom dipeptidyl peptidase 4 n=1 Tax=Polyplax serrata TaxID=468196 RepID=A0AAN8PMR2_POLSC
MVFPPGILIMLSCLGTILSNPVNVPNGKSPFTIEEAVLGALSASSFSGNWISDTELEYQDKATKDVKVLNVAENKTSTVLDGSILTTFRASKYRFSPDRNFVLIAYNESAVFRHTKTARYVVYSVQNRNYYDVSHKEKLQDATWSPKSNSLLYILGNNIYFVPEINEGMQSIQVTRSGIAGIVYNGISDWVYEEEVFSSSKAYWFSPSGDHLLYLTLNDTNVRKSTYFDYGEPGSINDQYPNEVVIRYPKSGTTSPDYKLWHVNLTDGNLETKLFSEAKEDIFYGATWVNDNDFLYEVTNRVQNESKTYLCNIKGMNTCSVIFKEVNKFGWVFGKLPSATDDLGRILRIEGQPVENSGKFSHIVLHNHNGSSYPLTGGYYDVLDIIAWDKANKVVYYEAAEEHNSTTKHVYSVSEVPKSKPICLTCRLKSPEGRFCKDGSAMFSIKFSYVIVHCNGPDPKVVYLFKNAPELRNPLKILENNSGLRNALKKKLFPEVMNFTVEVPGPFHADVRLLLPPNMDKSGATKYPLIIFVYAGPGSKGISDAFKFDWGLYLSTNLSIIYGFIDGRNTLKKGYDMLFAGYRALGTHEIEDQMQVTRYIQNKFPFVDSKRTGIWGWSYGGFATTKTLENDRKNTFKCGIAVAPVADWLYYDSVYTERYMGLPQENALGYERASLLKNVTNLRNKKYFLIHGNADDNVHYQNAMMLAKALERKNVPFELMSYPDENHGLLNVRKHLYHTMDKFWKVCFDLVV